MSWSAERSRAEANIVVKSVLEMEQTERFEPKRITLKFFGHHAQQKMQFVSWELGWETHVRIPFYGENIHSATCTAFFYGSAIVYYYLLLLTVYFPTTA